MSILSYKPYNFLPIKAFPIGDAKVIWRNERIFKGLVSDVELSRRYGMVLDERLSLRNSCQHKIVYAEKYGGFGVGVNGGGGRCVTFNNVQIKGVGITPLCSKNGPKSHAHGTLSLIEGVAEVIYSILVDEITPQGSVSSCALISSEELVSLYPDATLSSDLIPCRGTLLVRSVCVRPANFLVAKLWQDDSGLNDATRINEFYKEVESSVPDITELVAEVCFYLQCSAKQFAFTRVAGLTHGAITPSNISIYGQWLDLANVSFLPTNANYRVAEHPMPSFFEEPGAAKQSIIDILDNYCAYIDRSCDVKLLSKVFSDAYKHFKRTFYTWKIGLDNTNLDCFFNSECYEQLADTLDEIFVDNGPIIFDRPSSFNETDFSLELALFLVGEIYDFSIFHSINLDSLRENIKSISELFKARFYPEYDTSSIIRAMSISSLKRTVLSHIFYKNRLMADLYHLNSSENILEIKDYIRDIEFGIGWFYSGIEDGKVTLFECFDSKLYYSICVDSVFFQKKNILNKVEIKNISKYVNDMSSRCNFGTFDFGNYSRLLERTLLAHVRSFY